MSVHLPKTQSAIASQIMPNVNQFPSDPAAMPKDPQFRENHLSTSAIMSLHHKSEGNLIQIHEKRTFNNIMTILITTCRPARMGI